MRIDESWTRLDEFVAIYAAAMERLGAAEQWRLPSDYFVDLQAAVGSRVHLCVVEKDAELAAAALLTEIDGIVEYHLSGTAPEHVAARPTKLLIEQASRWARERGNRVFHLGGSLRHDDPLIHFRRGFSPLRHPVASWRLIADPDAFGRLMEHWGHLGESSAAQGGGDPGFFPGYRRPAGPCLRAATPTDRRARPRHGIERPDSGARDGQASPGARSPLTGARSRDAGVPQLDHTRVSMGNDSGGMTG